MISLAFYGFYRSFIRDVLFCQLALAPFYPFHDCAKMKCKMSCILNQSCTFSFSFQNPENTQLCLMWRIVKNINLKPARPPSLLQTSHHCREWQGDSVSFQFWHQRAPTLNMDHSGLMWTLLISCIGYNVIDQMRILKKNPPWYSSHTFINFLPWNKQRLDVFWDVLVELLRNRFHNHQNI